MKRILIFLFVLGMLMPTYVLLAQNKKVAILETVDKEGNISYAHKLMLRSNLAKAITRTPGYEAYDRTDMDAIMGEHNFQRTGMVSDDQIKLLGEMTGAAYILVAEAVKVDDANMFITAKILNVETARTEMSDNVLMGTDASQIQDGCVELASKLFGVSLGVPNKRNTQISNTNPSSERKQKGSVNKIFYSVFGHHDKDNNKKKKELENKMDFRISRAVFYGVDYSQVSVFGAKESPSEFIETFPKINRLLAEEYKKFIETLEKSLDIEVSDIDLAPAIGMVETIDPDRLFTYKSRKEGPDPIVVENIAKALSFINIPQRPGFGIIIFAVELNKDKGIGYYQLAIFDNESKEVLINEQIKGHAGGSGLRNYWANSIYEAFKKASLGRK